MARFARALGATLGVVLLGLIFALAPQKNASGAPGPTNVVVTNTPLPTTVTNNPLPVSGNVSVGNFPTIQNVNVTNTSVPVSGTVGVNSLPPVTLNGTSSVQVTNTTTNPVLDRNIDRPDNQPFNVVLCTNGTGVSFTQQFPCAFGGITSPEFFQVPTTTYTGQAVQRLVIEYVSGTCSAPPSSIYAVYLTNGSGLNVTGTSNAGYHFFPITEMPAGLGINFVTWAEPVHSYNDPGGFLGFFVQGTSTIVGCQMYISGYLTTQ